jgi:hypothetical protein
VVYFKGGYFTCHDEKSNVMENALDDWEKKAGAEE